VPAKLARVILVTLLLLTPAVARDGDRRVTRTFDSDTPDREPPGFVFQTTNNRPAGKWRVVRDERAPSHLLAQLDQNKDRQRHALAALDEPHYEDLRLSARIKLVAGDVDQSAGVFWRYRNSENHYLARLSVTDKNVRLYRVVNGNRIKFAGAEDVPLASNRWYTLRVEHRGKKIKVYLDDEMLFDAKDDRFDDDGKIGVWTQSDTTAHFDDLKAEELTKKDKDKD
jgi:hypothetical protein